MILSPWEVELEPEVEEWLDELSPHPFGVVTFQLDRLAGAGALLRMPHSRGLGDGLFELRFDLDRTAWRLTYFFGSDRRIVMLTAFRKQRMEERTEVARARTAMARCIGAGHTAEEDD